MLLFPNGGNAEFLRDGSNCLLYGRGDIDAAVSCINRIVNDRGLRETLYGGGFEDCGGEGLVKTDG